MANIKRPDPLHDKNYVEYDNIDILGTINYTNRYRFYNAISEMLTAKIAQAQRLRTMGATQMPIIRVNLGTPDEKEYPKQSERFFALLNNARRNGIIIETNVVQPICLNSWAGKVVREMATPGFRVMYEEAHHYYYPQTYDVNTKRVIQSPTKIIIPPEKLMEMGLCDTIFLNNGLIKTR